MIVLLKIDSISIKAPVTHKEESCILFIYMEKVYIVTQADLWYVVVCLVAIMSITWFTCSLATLVEDIDRSDQTRKYFCQYV